MDSNGQSVLPVYFFCTTQKLWRSRCSFFLHSGTWYRLYNSGGMTALSEYANYNRGNKSWIIASMRVQRPALSAVFNNQCWQSRVRGTGGPADICPWFIGWYSSLTGSGNTTKKCTGQSTSGFDFVTSAMKYRWRQVVWTLLTQVKQSWYQRNQMSPQEQAYPSGSMRVCIIAQYLMMSRRPVGRSLVW